MTEFAHGLQALRPQLLRFAHFKTWLIGILKHKLIDQIRRHSREVSATSRPNGATPWRPVAGALP